MVTDPYRKHLFNKYSNFLPNGPTRPFFDRLVLKLIFCWSLYGPLTAGRLSTLVCTRMFLCHSFREFSALKLRIFFRSTDFKALARRIWSHLECVHFQVWLAVLLTRVRITCLALNNFQSSYFATGNCYFPP